MNIIWIDCFIEGQTTHSHQFVMSIPTGNKKLKNLSSHRLTNEWARLKHVKIIFIGERSVLR